MTGIVIGQLLLICIKMRDDKEPPFLKRIWLCFSQPRRWWRREVMGWAIIALAKSEYEWKTIERDNEAMNVKARLIALENFLWEEQYKRLK